MGGFTFIAADTVMPTMIKNLGGSTWLISLMPMMMWLGMQGPPLFTAHFVERLDRLMPFVLKAGFMQRVPFIFSAICLFFFAESHPGITLAVVALAPFASGFFGGIHFSAWQELVARTLPANKRSSSLALRFTIYSFIGLSAGGVIKQVLERYPGPVGFGILHIIATVFAMLSYGVFALIKEDRGEPATKHQATKLLENLRSLPTLLKKERQFMLFILSRMTTMGLFIMTPFFAIHALNITGRSDDFLGYLVTAQMAGGILANLAGGWYGDRFGTKTPMITSRFLMIIACLGAMISQNYLAFVVIFGLYGFAFNLNNVVTTPMSMEICPSEKRPTYLSILAAMTFCALLFYSGVSTLVMEVSGSFQILAVLAVLMQAGSLYFIFRIKDPRKKLILKA